ncbi:DNA methyltransferase [Bosea sp. Leaf344]|uniref:DNA methyltransferase n=1 Tax=Bosea sp. Leaf344 TaxID=1736346 RepID=UPI000ABB18C0|nr:DNA methyltransferase [Bosea sp. Leaf344]
MDCDTLEAAAARLGEELVKARRSRKLSQRSLAAKVGLSRMTVANLEAARGTVAALVMVLNALAHRFTEQPADLELGPWLAHTRKRLGRSQERLSIQAGVSRPAIIRIERGEGTIATLSAAMVVLNLSPSLIDVGVEAAPAPLSTPTARLLHGDCRDLMRGFAEEGVFFDSIVTDPPYHLGSISRRFGRKGAAPLTGGEPGSNNPYRKIANGFMEQEWDGGDIAFDVQTWRAAFNVLKPGGHLVAFGGTRTFHRLAVAVEDAGFEIRDTIMWIYSSGFPKSLNLRGEHAGRGTALKPAFEPIIIARRPIAETSVASNVVRFGTGAMNIDACRVPTSERIEQGRVGRKLGTSVALTGRGLPPTGLVDVARKDRPTSRPGSKGFASFTEANVAAGIRPATSLKQYVEAPRAENGRWPANVIHDGIDETWGRYFYVAKASKADRGPRNKHPCVEPSELMKYLTRLVTPPGGIIFDPFAGSGSTAVAALQEGFSFVGSEMMAEYVEIARRRIAKVMPTTGSPLNDLAAEETPAFRTAS